MADPVHVLGYYFTDLITDLVADPVPASPALEFCILNTTYLR